MVRGRATGGDPDVEKNRLAAERGRYVPGEAPISCMAALCPRPLDQKRRIRGRPRLTGCAVAFWSTCSEPADRWHAASGWFLAPVSRSFERHQTAFRGQASSPAGEATAAHEARRLRNLSVPTGRSLKTHGSIPRGGDGLWPATRGGIDPPVARGSGTRPHRLS